MKWVYCEDLPKPQGDVCVDTSTRSLDNDPDLSLLFSDKSLFRPVVPALFMKLCFINGAEFISVYNREISIAPALGIGLDSGLILQIFRICGASIKKIRFGEMGHDDDCESTDENSKTKYALKLAVLVLKYCPNIEKLSFYQRDVDTTSSWINEQIILNRFASQLTMLTWDNEFSTRTPDLSACSGLRCFDYSTGTCETLILLLRSTGATLEHLHAGIEFVNERDCVTVVDVIYDKCRRLKSLWFSFDAQIVKHVGEPRYVSLLCSYGHQLDGVGIRCLSLESQREVVESCTGLTFDYVSIENMSDAKHAEVIGSHINSLNLFGMPCSRDELSAALCRCTKLKSLWTDNMEVLWLFPSLSQLKDLTLTTLGLTQHDILRLAAKTSNLEVVHFDLSSHIENGTIFKPLVESNKRLRRLIIRESRARRKRSLKRPPWNCVLRVLTQLCSTFSNSKLLVMDLRITEGLDITEQDVQNVCAALPCRGVQMEIHVGRDVFYMQTGELKNCTALCSTVF